VQLLLCLVYPLPILTIYDEHQTLSTGVVVSPKRADFILPSYIPNIKLDILIRHGLYVEADCGSVLIKKIKESAGCLVNAPVGIVVTDWFSLSLYKIAVGPL
jgi:hypothetical protein